MERSSAIATVRQFIYNSLSLSGAFVYRLGRKILILERGVRFP